MHSKGWGEPGEGRGCGLERAIGKAWDYNCKATNFALLFIYWVEFIYSFKKYS